MNEEYHRRCHARRGEEFSERTSSGVSTATLLSPLLGVLFLFVPLLFPLVVPTDVAPRPVPPFSTHHDERTVSASTRRTSRSAPNTVAATPPAICSGVRARLMTSTWCSLYVSRTSWPQPAAEAHSTSGTRHRGVCAPFGPVDGAVRADLAGADIGAEECARSRGVSCRVGPSLPRLSLLFGRIPRLNYY